jgi:damage-control phosphatase, subfamily I
MPATTNLPSMISDYRCFSCFANAFVKLVEKQGLNLDEKNAFIRKMAVLYSQYNGDFSAPVFSGELHTLLKQYTKNPDIYKEAKKQCNDTALQLYPGLKKIVLESANPFETALRLAIAGNIMDFGASPDFDIQATIDHVLKSDFAINHSARLKQSLLKAKTVLYLGDNAGEIVFDKLLIETLMHPGLVYAVRGVPVINDATLEDAHYVGIDTVADVISNGHYAPSTILEYCSPEFLAVYQKADVIISKGQGNLEGLFGKNTGKETFFLLMVKCAVVADALKVKKGGFVVVAG